jgi:hypothetical protein
MMDRSIKTIRPGATLLLPEEMEWPAAIGIEVADGRDATDPGRRTHHQGILGRHRGHWSLRGHPKTDGVGRGSNGLEGGTGRGLAMKELASNGKIKNLRHG